MNYFQLRPGGGRGRVTSILFLAGFVLVPSIGFAQGNFGPLTVGAGMRTFFTHEQVDKGGDSDRFALDSIRLYINGTVTGKVKFMFNTEYNSSDSRVNILDAVARLEFHPKFNIWAGRLLPPSDRANLAGPYYNSHWGVYSDGIQNGHPFIFQGRDDGVAYWGDFGKVKLSAGAFDGGTATGRPEVIGAFRAQIHFWDKEEGYYLNSTYYGSKQLLTLGAATQVQGGRTATTVDFLLERKLANAGVITVESEYSNYNRLGGYDARFAKSQGAYGLLAYVLPKPVGPGKIQLLGKFSKADFTHGGTALNYNQKTTEFNVNYLFKEFNGRVMTFFRKADYSRGKPTSWAAGLGLQIQI